MTDPQQAARIAAMRARRGQAPVQISTSPAAADPAQRPVSWAPPVVAHSRAADVAEAHMVHRTSTTPEVAVVGERPAARGAARTARPDKGRHPHVAAGARILVTGLTASSIFGLTSVIASANRPIVPAADPSQVASAENTAPTTVPPSTAVPAPTAPAAPVPTVLTLPPAVSTVNPPQAAAPQPAAQQPAAQQPAAAPAPKPAKAPAKPPVTTQAPATTQPPPPPPPATTKASG